MAWDPAQEPGWTRILKNSTPERILPIRKGTQEEDKPETALLGSARRLDPKAIGRDCAPDRNLYGCDYSVVNEACSAKIELLGLDGCEAS